MQESLREGRWTALGGGQRLRVDIGARSNGINIIDHVISPFSYSLATIDQLWGNCLTKTCL
jgi:hypothetical protein